MFARSLHQTMAPMRRYMSTASALKCCIVGAGPSGFYTAKYLMKELPEVTVDILEQLPTPYGLVRYGVAPDHPEVKSVQHDFAKVAKEDNVRFVGNVCVGKDVDLEQLRGMYDVVVLSYGASEDRDLGLSGEESLGNVLSAREFVNWYNGHPDFVMHPPSLMCEDVVVVGQGNVGIDCARVLTKSVDELASTDITNYALELLSASRVKRVSVVGRRGHVQAAFTMKEVRELTKLDDVGLVVHPDELEMGMTDASKEEVASQRAKKRMNDLLRKAAANYDVAITKPRQIHLRFLCSPAELIPSEDDPAVVGGLKVERTSLQGDALAQRAVGTGEFETIPCGLLLKSIGYKSVPLPGVPFDDNRHVVRNQSGKVFDVNPETKSTEPVHGLYTAGWVKRGPSGIIGTNIVDAKDTVASIVHDVKQGNINPRSTEAKDITELVDATVDWQAFQLIAREEYARGANEVPEKPREKLVSVDEMLRVALGKRDR